MSLTFHLISSSRRDRPGPLIPALSCTLRGTAIIRTFDPEQVHTVSVSRILTVLNLTVISFLTFFRLELNIDYFDELSPAQGVTGLVDLWIPVPRARSIVRELYARCRPPRSVPVELVELLSPILDSCWTLHDLTKSSSSLLHNWCLKDITLTSYCTKALLSKTFGITDVVHQSDRGLWLRTSVDHDLSIFATAAQDPNDRAILRWSISAAQRFLLDGASIDDAIKSDWREVLDLVCAWMGPASHLSPIDLITSEARESFEASTVDILDRILLQYRKLTASSKKAKTYSLKDAVLRSSMSLRLANQEVKMKRPTPSMEQSGCATKGSQSRTIAVQTDEQPVEILPSYILKPVLEVNQSSIYSIEKWTMRAFAFACMLYMMYVKRESLE